MATASTLFLPFPGQLDSRVASHRIVWHCGRFTLFLLCSIEKFACQELCKAFAKRKRQSSRVRERGQNGPRAKAAEWVKEQQGENKFCSGQKVCAFLSPRCQFFCFFFSPHWTHNKRKTEEKKRKNKRRKISLSIETIKTIEDHLPGCCFCCCFRFSFSTRVSCHCRGGRAGERLLDCSTLHYSWR